MLNNLFHDVPNVCSWSKVWTPGTPVQDPDSLTTKPCCCNKRRIQFSLVFFCVGLAYFRGQCQDGAYVTLKSVYTFVRCSFYTQSWCWCVANSPYLFQTVPPSVPPKFLETRCDQIQHYPVLFLKTITHLICFLGPVVNKIWVCEICKILNSVLILPNISSVIESGLRIQIHIFIFFFSK